MKILIKPEMAHVLNWNEVLYKKDKFIVSDMNYYTFMDIVKIHDYEGFLKLSSLDQEKLKFAINAIIAENKDLSPEIIINYICGLNREQLESLGNNYVEIISNFLKSNDFQMKDGKGLIYLNSDLIDFEFVFRNFPDMKVLFIYNEEKGTLTLIDRNLHVLEKFTGKKETDIYDIFEEYEEKKLKKDKDKYYNDLLNKLLLDYFSTDTFLENFLDEIFFKISNLIMMEDVFEIDERNRKLLLEHYKELSKKDEKMEKALLKIFNKKGIDKYKEVEKALK